MLVLTSKAQSDMQEPQKQGRAMTSSTGLPASLTVLEAQSYLQTPDQLAHLVEGCLQLIEICQELGKDDQLLSLLDAQAQDMQHSPAFARLHCLQRGATCCQLIRNHQQLLCSPCTWQLWLKTK